METFVSLRDIPGYWEKEEMDRASRRLSWKDPNHSEMAERESESVENHVWLATASRSILLNRQDRDA
ncbi:MAG: hypothetical protein JWM11_3493 [Planctomycetaceae bacterium]|nr:hypothetical protein [Planctomycetaceae bacterium]